MTDARHDGAPVAGRHDFRFVPIKLTGVPERKDHTPPPDLDGDREAILSLIKNK